MSTLMQASRQWSSRPADERFTSLTELRASLLAQRAISRAAVVPSRALTVQPVADDPKFRGLEIVGGAGVGYNPTHQAFGQLASLVGAPAGYLRTLPTPMVADCLNYGLKVTRDAQDVGVLLTKNGDSTMRAVTGPNYGRIWNSDIADALVDNFGDGVSGDGFRVPGEFGKSVEVTKANTTLYAGDRDMFVFLADEKNRIEIADRRDGQSGSLARGFFVWNSEVGSATFGIAAFLFDYVCCNRIVWGAREFKQVTIRHTKSAPGRFLEEIQPALLSYSNSSQTSVVAAIADAKQQRLDNVEEFLAKRFTRSVAGKIMKAHEDDEGRPIESRWDAVTGITAYARDIQFQDERVSVEREAGKLLDN